MLELVFPRATDSACTILCLGAHSDDIEIGCGGTILRLLNTYPKVVVYWIVFSADEARAKEARKSAGLFLSRANSESVAIENFRNSFFPFVGGKIKEYFEQLKQECSPDIIFTHYRNDLHQDHRLISDLTWNTFRNQLILEYEIPKYDGDFGTPNVFVHLDKTVSERKIEYILNSFRSQAQKQWFDKETFFSIMRLRGIEAVAPQKYAEAFYCRKIVLGATVSS